jgi:hypothetical protein
VVPDESPLPVPTAKRPAWPSGRSACRGLLFIRPCRPSPRACRPSTAPGRPGW